MEVVTMQGIGNDYVYVDCFDQQVPEPERTSVYISNRRFGIGSDGLVLISPSERADCRMSIYNADGSQALMCGNGIRCVGKYVYDHGLIPSDRRAMTVETLSGIKKLDFTVEHGKAKQFTVDMGKGELTSKLPEPIEAAGRNLEFVGISVGNPHAVLFAPDVDAVDLGVVGPALELHKRFAPYRVNAEFVQVIDRTHLKMRVWERGSGETWACGTGATASALASILMGYAEDQVTVELRGGSLTIRLCREGDHLFMTGPAEEVFCGSIVLPWE